MSNTQSHLMQCFAREQFGEHAQVMLEMAALQAAVVGKRARVMASAVDTHWPQEIYENLQHVVRSIWNTIDDVKGDHWSVNAQEFLGNTGSVNFLSYHNLLGEPSSQEEKVFTATYFAFTAHLANLLLAPRIPNGYFIGREAHEIELAPLLPVLSAPWVSVMGPVI